MNIISVIVPVYNTERVLEKCVDSILGQSFLDFELILVDDGSTDGSPAICDRYAEVDNRVKVIHLTNGGVSRARNVGMDAATGEYISFVDSDDWIDVRYLEKLYECVEKSGIRPDLVTSGIYRWKGDSIIESSGIPDRKNRIYSFNIEQDLLAQIEESVITLVTSKLYRRESLIRNGMRLDEKMHYAEDRDFNVRLLNVINNSVSVNYIGYNYRVGQESSLSTCKMGYSIEVDIDYWNKLSALFENRGFESAPVGSMLNRRLFFFFSDAFVSYAVGHSLTDTYRYIRNVMARPEAKKLSVCNDVVIEAPAYMRYVVCGRKSFAASVLYKLLAWKS